MTVPLEECVRVHVRWLLRRDLPELLRIEQASFDHAWTEEDVLRALQQPNHFSLVAEHEEMVIGYILYDLHKSKLHILRLAVLPEYRRQGIGAQFVTTLKGKLSIHRRTRITAVVRERNLDALHFFHRQGFLATTVLRAYYMDSCEDGFLMQYKLPGVDEDSED
jgi:ribosomal-protein-alanine N-acetyltransferase